MKKEALQAAQELEILTGLEALKQVATMIDKVSSCCSPARARAHGRACFAAWRSVVGENCDRRDPDITVCRTSQHDDSSLRRMKWRSWSPFRSKPRSAESRAYRKCVASRFGRPDYLRVAEHTNIYRARQLVTEHLQGATDSSPPQPPDCADTRPGLAKFFITRSITAPGATNAPTTRQAQLMESGKSRGT